MRRKIITILCVLCALFLTLGIFGCKDGEQKPQVAVGVLNGGFESANLSGWTVEYGNAFDDDCVASDKYFTFADDQNNNEISINHTGNWYLTGKGFHGKYSGARTGAIRSTEFVIPADGVISVKLAGGALTVGKGTEAPFKAKEKLCYLGVYTAKDDMLIAIQTNEYFAEHTESYIIPGRYSAGVYNTDNFYEYTIDVKDYKGEKAYIRIVDNDDSWYYGYFAVDDIRIGQDALSQTEGAFFTKTKNFVQDVDAPSKYEIKNGGFETGSLAGWTVLEGDAFSNEGVNSESVWWNENITYSRDGNYHYGKYLPSATGVMRSSEFELGGSGYVTFKLGGCADNTRTYIRFLIKQGEDFVEVARYSNHKYWNSQFPYVPNGMHLLNMVQYYADLSAYIGETMVMEVVDQNTSGDDLACITLDSVKTYWEQKPLWIDSESFLAVYDVDIMPESEYQVVNGGFETGDLTGWTLSGDKIGVVTNANGWWAENLPYNKKGAHLFSGIVDEGAGVLESNKGTLTSSAFTVGGSGFITFMLGGGGNPLECYISIIDASTEVELLRFGNKAFRDLGLGLINNGSNLANMVWYKADLSAYMGQELKIKVVDNGATSWGLLTVDSFVTYYKSSAGVPAKAILAVDIKPTELPDNPLGYDSEYQVLNGDFETGDLTGWTLEKTSGATEIGYVSGQDVYWRDSNNSYNKDGSYLFSGVEDVNGSYESGQGTLTSSTFKVGGTGFITFKLGGGYNENCYIEIVKKNGTVIAKYHNDNPDSNKGTMFLYKADLSDYLNEEVFIRVVDNASEAWGCLAVDSFITYYELVGDLPEGAILAENKLNNL